ncbi:hypothetical protein Tco_1417135, partial [Tanacetum coccineum]
QDEEEIGGISISIPYLALPSFSLRHRGTVMYMTEEVER